MTDNTEQEQAAQLARQVEAMREQGMPIFREVRQFIDNAQADEASAAQSLPSLVRQIGEAMDSADEVIGAVRKLGGLAGTAANTSQASASLTAVAMITASGGLTLAKPALGGEDRHQDRIHKRCDVEAIITTFRPSTAVTAHGGMPASSTC